MTESKKYNLNKEDATKILKGAGIAVGGALLTYGAQVLTQIDFGIWTPTVVAIGCILINAGRKALRGKK